MEYTKYNFNVSPFRSIFYKIALKLYRSNIKSQGFYNWHYNIFSKGYDSVMRLSLPNYFKVIDMFIDENINKDSTVLDLCCGTGNITLAAAKKAKNVIGLDISGGMLSKAISKAAKNELKNVMFAFANVKDRLDFHDESFDVITAGWSVPGNWPVFKNKNQDIMKEANRILKKGGKLILYEGHYDISTFYLTKEEYDSILTKAGYKNIEIMDINGFYILVTCTK